MHGDVSPGEFVTFKDGRKTRIACVLKRASKSKGTYGATLGVMPTADEGEVVFILKPYRTLELTAYVPKGRAKREKDGES